MKFCASVLCFALTLSICEVFGDDEYKEHCNGLKCPVYKVLEKSDGWEHRRYEPSEWVAARSNGSAYDSARRTSFMKLFRYISGKNKDGIKIPMTAPVLIRNTKDFDSGFLMHFYVPPHPGKSTPQPIEANLQIVKYPAIEVYVRSYGWWSSESKVKKNIGELEALLKKAGKNFNDKEIMYAGYDSPFRIFNRHNEVMLLAN